VPLQLKHPTQYHYNEFSQVFGVSLTRFWHPMFGFDVIRFDQHLNVPDNVSTHDHVFSLHGARGVSICKAILSIQAPKAKEAQHAGAHSGDT
jgi:hypothetical protein